MWINVPVVLIGLAISLAVAWIAGGLDKKYWNR